MDLQPFFNIDNTGGRCQSAGLPEDHDYDAINDETFGCEIRNFNDDDLEDFANRTAGLILDEPSIHKNVSQESNYNDEFLRASTLEDIEREQLKEICQNNYVDDEKNVMPQMTTVPLCVEELERQMLQETIRPFSCRQQSPLSINSQSRILQNFLPQIPIDGHYGNFSSFSTVPQCFSRPPPIVFFQDNNSASLCNRINEKKSWQQNSRSVSGGGNDCYFPDQSHIYSTHKNLFPSAKNFGNDSGQRNYKKEKYSHNNNRHNRPKGLPSNKTISDFAFDPYAGFMSKKEREWLIKIHLIQCVGTGDSLDDDFYYSMWKKRNVLKKDPGACKIKIRPRYYSFDETYPVSTYIPPSFSGALGKLTHFSAKIPRQVIDLTFDNVDEEDLDNSVNKNMQKKLKAMLMRIENAALVLSQCDNFKRKLTTDQVVNKDLQQIVKKKVQMILFSVCTIEVLPTVMLIQKGRNLLFQIMDFCFVEEDMIDILKIMIKTLPKYAKRIPDSSIVDCTKHFYLFISSLSNQNIIEIVNELNFDVPLVGVSKVLFTTLIILLIFIIKKKVSTFEIYKSSLMLWLNTNCNDMDTTPFKNFFGVEELFVLEELSCLNDWLSNKIPQDGSIAKMLVNSIKKLLISNSSHLLNVC